MPNTKSTIKDYIYDFDNLFSTLLNLKYWIIGLTSFTTILIIVFAATKTPIYQASSNMNVGSYEVLNLECNKRDIRTVDYCVQTFKQNELFMNSDVVEDYINSFASVNLENQILVIKNGDNTLTLLSRAGSIEEAKISIQKIKKYVSQLNLKNIESLENQWGSRIRKMEQNVSNLINWDLTPIQKENDYQLLQLNKSIALNKAKLIEIQSQQKKLNKNLVRTVSNSLDRKIKELSKEISYIKDFELPFYEAKIFSHDQQLKLSNSLILELKKQLKQSNSILSSINLNEITETKSLDLNKTNMISLRLKESQYLRDSIAITSEKILELEVDVVKTEKKLKLELEYLEVLSSQESLQNLLALLKNYKEKWFERENTNFDTTNLLEIFSIDELAFLSLTTSGQLNFNVEKKIIELELKKEDTEGLVSSLIDEKYSYINVAIPRDELDLYAINIEISNLRMLIDRYKDLLAAKNYINMAFTGEIYAPIKQLTPNLTKYAAFGFLASLSLFLFLFSLLSLISPKKKNV